MKTLPLRLVSLALVALALTSNTARANDFPTVERVIYVQECMRAHPGPSFEMTNKCSCALDILANDVNFDDYVTLSTITKAMTISGERGNIIREAAVFDPQAKRYRELKTKAEKGCFLNPEVR